MAVVLAALVFVLVGIRTSYGVVLMDAICSGLSSGNVNIGPGTVREVKLTGSSQYDGPFRTCSLTLTPSTNCSVLMEFEWVDIYTATGPAQCSDYLEIMYANNQGARQRATVCGSGDQDDISSRNQVTLTFISTGGSGRGFSLLASCETDKSTPTVDHVTAIVAGVVPTLLLAVGVTAATVWFLWKRRQEARADDRVAIVDNIQTVPVYPNPINGELPTHVDHDATNGHYPAPSETSLDRDHQPVSMDGMKIHYLPQYKETEEKSTS